MSKILQTLEFDNVKGIVKRYCVCTLGRHIVEKLTPFESLEKAQRALAEVSEMKLYLSEKPRLALQGARDAVNIIEILVLSLPDLIMSYGICRVCSISS